MSKKLYTEYFHYNFLVHEKVVLVDLEVFGVAGLAQRLLQHPVDFAEELLLVLNLALYLYLYMYI